MKTDQNYLMKNFNMTRPFSLSGLASIVRFTASLCSQGSWGSLVLLSKLGRFLLFLVGVGFLSVVLIACAGGGGGSGGSSGGSMNNGSMGNGSMDGEPGNGSPITSADDDKDGIENSRDNCPDVANPRQTNTDRADDGGDACDDDDDNDGLNDVDEPAGCELDSDCDDDGLDDGDEPAGCVENADCDNDGVGDGIEARGCAKLPDCDSDNAEDGTDIDDDGDGLIEIATAAHLNEVRYALNGSGRRSSDGGMLDQTGCGDGTTTSCNGYELVADISLAAYADADGGKGWQPLGHDTDNATGGCQGDAFNGIFEGNGFMISDLNISRSGEDCVGLFGHIAANSTIRNLRLSAETVIGLANVGGLVGWGDMARVVYSSVVMEEIMGFGAVGGLVGRGLSARIHSSSVVVGEVRGVDSGPFSNLYISGLVGQGSSTQIYSSSVVAGEVAGRNVISGLIVGEGSSARIVSSSVVVGEVSGGDSVGGLAGTLSGGQIAYSYVVSGSNTNMLAGTGSGTGNASYWDSDTSGRNSGNHGEAKTSEQLQMPTGYDGIYENWDEDMDIFGTNDVPLAVWCDEDNSGSIEGDEKIDDNLIWDFGTSSQYPAIRCTPIAPDDWRSWWSLEGTPAKPQLNRTRLDALLP